MTVVGRMVHTVVGFGGSTKVILNLPILALVDNIPIFQKIPQLGINMLVLLSHVLIRILNA